MKMYELKEGMELFDEANGRYIIVGKLYPDQNTCLCRTYEIDEDGNEVNEEETLFTLRELTRF